MTNRKTLQYSSRLPVFSVLGSFLLLLAVLFLGMYALTFVTKASSGILIRTVFLLSGTLGLIVAWKFLSMHLVVPHAKPFVFTWRRLTEGYRAAMRGTTSVLKKSRKHLYDQFKRTA